jgi:hypothetical protein
MAFNQQAEDEALERAREVENLWGHPQKRWDALIQRVQNDGIRQFGEVMEEWLDLIWCLDQCRIEDAPPEGMGKMTTKEGKPTTFRSRMDGIYRGKGNLFATLLSLLLNNRTGQTIRSRSKIKGFSQEHQIDLAWPDREVAPLMCAESKVTGGPAYRDYPARGAMADWSNRRKELKFAATDLKLSRRKQTRKIGHWGAWRQKASPATFMVWGARLRPQDSIEKMIKETQALLKTYLDGAGIFAWQENAAGDGYEPVEFPGATTIETIDEVLWRIEDEINDAIDSGALDEEIDLATPIDVTELAEDKPMEE